MISGTFVFRNLNKLDVSDSTKKIIYKTSISTEVQKVLDTIQIGAVEKTDIENIVKTIATETQTASTVDLTPIIDAICDDLLEKEILINRNIIKDAIITLIPKTTIYDYLDFTQSEIVIQEQKKVLFDNVMKKVDEVLDTENLTNMSQENLEKIINALNQVTGLSFDVNDLMIAISNDITNKINKNNLKLAILDIIKSKEEFWIGSFEDFPLSPKKGSVFKNLTDGNTYLFDGEKWVLTNLTKEDLNTIPYSQFSDEIDLILSEFNLTNITDKTLLEILNKFLNLLSSGVATSLNLNEILATIKSRLTYLQLSFQSVAGNDIVIDLTPEQYNMGEAVIIPTEVALTVKEETPYIVQLDDNSISLNIKDYMLKTNTTDFDIKAKLISPKFKVSVFGGNKLDFDKEDAWKVLTNDGENFRWEYIETFFKDGVGLLKVVKTLVDRDAIPEKYLVNGMIVYVQSLGVYYSLVDIETRYWSVFHKNDLSLKEITRPVVYRGIKLGHSDTGSNLKVSKLITKVIDTKDDYKYLEEFIDQTQPNLVSFKNVGFTQAFVNIDKGSHILNPNSVLEIPFDFSMKVELKGLFNFVGALITFEVTSEEFEERNCKKNGFKDEPQSLFTPYF